MASRDDGRESVRATVFASYVFSDLGTGIFHWSVDNYGDKNTPIAGNVIDAFQGHHRWPWTITKRQWANNIHKTCELFSLLCRSCWRSVEATCKEAVIAICFSGHFGR